MEEKDYSLVFIGNTQVGLIGFKEIFDEMKSQRGKAEPDLKEMLVEKAAKKNHTPSSVKEDYKRALFREFKKFLGEKVEEEKSEFLDVVILGPGCYSCDKVERDVMAVLSETGMKAGLNHITDPKLMAQYGVVITPTLVINGKVKSRGTLPSKSMIKKWLGEEKG